MTKKIKFWLLLTVGMATMVFNSYSQNTTQEKGVVINGVKWATRNVDSPGIFAAKPEDAGMFYQWNSRVGWRLTKPIKNSDGGTKWSNSKKSGNSWKNSNDPSPVGWRLPTLNEVEKLYDKDKVRIEWTTLNGVKGTKFTDKTSGNSIFMPAVGFLNGDDGTLDTSVGLYWGMQGRTNDEANYFAIVDGDAKWDGSIPRNMGCTVRAVAE